MTDFKNGNLCGVTAEVNDVLKKLRDSKKEIIEMLDFVPTVMEEVVEKAQEELGGVLDEMKAGLAEIPTLPTINLQAELKNLTSMIPGSDVFNSAVAKITLEFGSAIAKIEGGLEGLISSAFETVSEDLSRLTGDICSVCANIEKSPGVPPKTIADAVKKPIELTLGEPLSKVNQNPYVAAMIDGINSARARHAVTKDQPIEDTGAFRVAPKKLIVNISAPQADNIEWKIPDVMYSGTATTTWTWWTDLTVEIRAAQNDRGDGVKNVVRPGSGNNVAPPGSKFIHKIDKGWTAFTAEDLDANTQQTADSFKKAGILKLTKAQLKIIAVRVPKGAARIRAVLRRPNPVPGVVQDFKLLVKWSVYSNYTADVKERAEPEDCGDFCKTLRPELEIDEGVKYKVYKDHLGFPTFGIGHLILPSDPEFGKPDDTPVSKARVEQAFAQDCANVLADCRIEYPDFDTLPCEVRLIIGNMMFNLGRTRLSKFKLMKFGVNGKNYQVAAAEMKNSDWYGQVGNRADRLIDRMKRLPSSLA
jgi:lysozyme